MLTVPEVAKEFKLSKRRVYELIEEKKLNVIPMHARVLRDDVYRDLLKTYREKHNKLNREKQK